jgi:hypothetical protein
VAEGGWEAARVRVERAVAAFEAQRVGWEEVAVGREQAEGATLQTHPANRCQILPLPFLRYRFCELKYRGAVGRRQVHCTLIVKIIRFYC